MQPLRTHVDFETRSLIDLIKLGEHAYARDASTSPLMLTYGTAPKGITPRFELVDFFEDQQYVQSVYPSVPIEQAGQKYRVPCPPAILTAITRGDTFVAHNARFEQAIWYYICHLRWGWPLPIRWSCTAARARYFGIRAALAGAASDLEVIHQKDERGKAFIDTFCKPRKYYGKKADGRVRELWAEPFELPEAYAIGKAYCLSDGEAEADIDALLPDLPDFEQRAWEWDFNINLRGVPIDARSVARAIEFSDKYTLQAVTRFEAITSLRPTQRDRVLEYLQQREEIESLGDLRSKTLKRIVADEFPDDLKDVISIRLDCSLASTKKLGTMLRTTDDDGNARGIHLYGGAHTMRWSAKRVQTQNMKRGDKDTQARMFKFLENDVWDIPYNSGQNSILDIAEDPPWKRDADWRFIRPLRDLSMSMRGFIKAPKGKKLVAGDYAQIEARVLSWLARAMSKLDAFRNKRDLYVEFASVMYKRAYDDYFTEVNGKREVRKEVAFERQVAKSAELGCGYGLGGPKFQEYCDNSDIIIDLETAKRTVDAWREANPHIVALWGRMEAAAILATSKPGEVFQIGGTGVSFQTWHIDEERYWLICQLPSGRGIYYYRPKVEYVMKWGNLKEQLTFRREWNGKSYRESTYGGKITENVVQAVARDIMCVGGFKVEQAGYPAIMLVHDEIVTLVDEGFGSHEDMCKLMCVQEPWITDLPIAADGATMQRYGK